MSSRGKRREPQLQSDDASGGHRLKRLIDALPLPAVGVDEDLRVIIWNTAAERAFGWSAADVMGDPVPMIPPEGMAEFRERVAGIFSGRTFPTVEVTRLRRDGTTVRALMSSSAMPPDQGHGPAAMAVYVDLTELRAAEARVSEGEATMRLMLAQAPAIVWTTDTNLVFTSSSGAGLQTLGSAPGRMNGHPVTEIIKDPSAIRSIEAALRGESSRYTLVYQGRNFDTSIEPLRAPDGSIRGTVAVSFDVTDRERAQEQLRESREELRRLSAHVNMVEEEERRRIAREIHDEMGGRLTALHLELDLLRRELGESPLRARIDSMAALIVQTTETVRRVASELRPSILDDFGLIAAIENELTAMRRRTGIEFDLDAPEGRLPIDRDSKTAVYRIVQEALTNVARHSGASRVLVRIALFADALDLLVRDDGRGITEEQTRGTTRLGLVGMRERAYALGGQLEVRGVPDGGTSIRVRLPVNLRPLR